ncbi:MAG: DUF4177 domain-containing protein [Bacteroidota bacterium]
MKEYKVETRAYYSKLTTNRNHIVESSQMEIQDIIDSSVSDGWQLASTDAAAFGAAMYVYLYFEREVDASLRAPFG